MNIPKLTIVPEPQVFEQNFVRELPVARKPSVLLSQDDLAVKIGVGVEEIHMEMRRKEQEQNYHRPFSSNPRGTSLETVKQCRSIVVEWMTEVATSYSLSNITIHLAVAIMDRLLGELDVSRGMIQLVGTTCILIAAKLEEMEENVPSIVQLNACTDDTYTPELIKQMEAMSLNRLKWDTNAVTPIHFLGVYLDGTLSPNELVLNFPIGPAYGRISYDLASFSEFFVDLCRQDFEFLRYLPSMIAASCVAVTRRMIKVTPIWSERLHQVTGYSDKDISYCAEHIWSVFEANFILPGSPRSLS